MGTDRQRDRLYTNAFHGHSCFRTVANTLLSGGVTESDRFLGQTRSLLRASGG
jgi:hypothetical protein